MILYGAKQSGHSYKVRQALLFAGLPHDYHAIDLSVPRALRPAPFKAASPFGEVPVLIDGDNVMAQSNAILLHLARLTGTMAGDGESDWNAVTMWLFWEANRIGRSYPNLRYYRLFDQSAAPGLVTWFEQTAIADLERLNDELSERPFLLSQFTVADLSCAAYMLYGGEFGLDMTRWPHVLRWLDRIRALPGWQHPLHIMGP